MNFIGKLLPVEGYQVQRRDALPHGYAISLSHLYQPLIGIESVSLYHTLLNETWISMEQTQTHHALMNYLKLPLDVIYEARLKLEGIGLLKTFMKEQNDGKIYIYQLSSPFSPSDFFTDGMLCGMLLHELGEKRFSQLKEKLAGTHDEVDGAKEVTASFADVFKEQPQASEAVSQQHHEQKGPNVEWGAVDFTWLHTSLKQRLLPAEQILTYENKRVISQMAVLYDLETIEIEKALHWALSEAHQLNHKEFNAACHDLYKEKCRNTPAKQPSAISVKQTVQKKDPAKMSKEERLIHQFETMSPREILEDFSSGHEASEQDLKMIRDVMTQQGLPAPVMNVLVHYVMLQTNMKLSKAYLEKIASHWSRAKLKTAKEAMDFARHENERQSGQKSNNTSYRPYQRNVKREIVPEWIQQAKTQESKKSSSLPKRSDEKDQAEIASVLNELINSSKK